MTVFGTEEIVEEQVIEEEMPSFNHSYISWRIVQQLSQNSEIAPLPELTLDIGNGLTPDISVYPLEKVKPDFWHDVTKYAELPLLAIEIVSPNQPINSLIAKAELLIEFGIKIVWVIEPVTKSIIVVTQNDKQSFKSEVVESEGVKVDFRRIFGDS